MKFNREWRNSNWAPYTIAACSAVVLYLALTHLGVIGGIIAKVIKVTAPVFAGLIIAYLIDPVARFFERSVFAKCKNKHGGRQVSVTLALIVVIGIVTLLVAAITPPLIDGFINLFSTLGESFEGFQETIGEYTRKWLGRDFDMHLVGSITGSLMGDAGDASAGVVTIIETSQNVGTGFVTFILGLIIAVYFLYDKERLVKAANRLAKRILKNGKYDAVVMFCTRCDKILIRYIGCTIAEAFIVGIANGIFMSILGMPYIVLVSVLVGATNIIPTFGPLMGGLVGVILLYTVDPWLSLWFLIFTVVIQTVDGYILKPKLFGNSLGVSSILVIISIIVGGRIFGVIGIILAIPFAAIIHFAVHEYIPMMNEKSEE